MKKTCIICGQELENGKYCQFCKRLLKKKRELREKLKVIDKILKNRSKYKIKMHIETEDRKEKEEHYLLLLESERV